MRSWWARIRWADVLVGAVVLGLFALQWVVLDRELPSSRPGCVDTAMLACWDLRGALITALSIPFWYAAWAACLRPCPRLLRWLTPLAVLSAAAQIHRLLTWELPVPGRLAVLVVSYLVPAAVMSAMNATAATRRTPAADR